MPDYPDYSERALQHGALSTRYAPFVNYGWSGNVAASTYIESEWYIPNDDYTYTLIQVYIDYSFSNLTHSYVEYNSQAIGEMFHNDNALFHFIGGRPLKLDYGDVLTTGALNITGSVQTINMIVNSLREPK